MSLFEQKNSGVFFCFLKNEVTSSIKPASPPPLPWKLYGSRDEQNAESLAGLGFLCFSSVRYFSIYKVLGSTTLLQKMILEDEVPHPSLSVTSLAVRVRGRDRRSCVSLRNLVRLYHHFLLHQVRSWPCAGWGKPINGGLAAVLQGYPACSSPMYFCPRLPSGNQIKWWWASSGTWCHPVHPRQMSTQAPRGALGCCAIKPAELILLLSLLGSAKAILYKIQSHTLYLLFTCR